MTLIVEIGENTEIKSKQSNYSSRRKRLGCSPNPYRLRLAMNGGLSLFNPFLTETVRLHTSGFSAEYGDFMSSVMEVDSRFGRFDRIGYGVSLNTLEANGYAEGPLPEKTGTWIASIRRTHFDLLADQFFSEQTAYPRSFDFQGKAKIRLPNNQNVYMTTFHTDEKCDMDFSSEDVWMLKESASLHFYSTEWQYDNDKLKDNIKIAYYKENMDYQILLFENDVLGDYFLNTDHFSVKEDLQYSLSPKFLFEHGVHFSSEKSDLKIESNKQSITFARHEIPPNILFNKTISHFAGYMQLTQKWTSYLQSRIGMRYDYSDLIRKGDVSPHLSLWLLVIPKLTFTGFYGQCHQYPQARSVFYRDRPLNLGLNLDGLQSEQADHYVIGMQYQWPLGIATKIELYHKAYHRLLLPEDNFTYKPINGGLGNSTGLEIIIEKKHNENAFWHGFAEYAFGRSHYRYNDSEEWIPFNFDRRHSLTLFNKIRLGKGFEISGIWQYATGLPYNEVVGVIKTPHRQKTFIRTDHNPNRFAPYHRLDIRFSYTWFKREKHLTCYFDLINLYNRRNLYDWIWDVSSKWNPDIHDYEKKYLNIRSVAMLPLIPSVGVSYHF